MKMMTFHTHSGSARFHRVAQLDLTNHGYAGAMHDMVQRMRDGAETLAVNMSNTVNHLQTSAKDGAPLFLLGGVVTVLFAMATTIGLGFRGSL